VTEYTFQIKDTCVDSLLKFRFNLDLINWLID